MQHILDDPRDTRRVVLTGSNSFQRNQKIAQSLAGRLRLLTILPTTRDEIPMALRPATVDESLWMGSYPAIYDESLVPTEWHADYYNTYVQKDVRALIGVQDLGRFDTFMRLCAGRTGQVLNLSSLASNVGVSVKTVDWFNRLQHRQHSSLIYGGSENFTYQGCNVANWTNVSAAVAPPLAATPGQEIA